MSETYIPGAAAFGGQAMREITEYLTQIAINNISYKQKLGTVVLGSKDKDGEIVKGLIAFEADAIKEAGEDDAASIRCQAGSALAGAVSSAFIVAGGYLANRRDGLQEKLTKANNRFNTCEENLKFMDELPTTSAAASKSVVSESVDITRKQTIENMKKDFQWDNPETVLKKANLDVPNTTENKLQNAIHTEDKNSIKSAIIEERKKVDKEITDITSNMNGNMTRYQIYGQFLEHSVDAGCKFGQADFTKDKAEEDQTRQVMSTLSSIATNQLYSNVDKSQQSAEQAVQTAQQNLAALYAETHRA